MMATQLTTNNDASASSFIHMVRQPRIAFAGVVALCLVGCGVVEFGSHVLREQSWLQIYQGGQYVGLVPNQTRVTENMERIADGYGVKYQAVPIHANVSKGYDWRRVASFPTSAAVIELNDKPLVYTGSVKTANEVLQNVKSALTAKLSHATHVTSAFVGHVRVTAVTVSVTDIEDAQSATRLLLQPASSTLAGRSATPYVQMIKTGQTSEGNPSRLAPLLRVKSTATVQKTVSVPYPVKHVKDDHLGKGETKVMQAGQPGKELQTVKETFVDGKVHSSQVLSKKVVVQPIAAIVDKGTNSGIASGHWVWPTDGYTITSPFGWRSFGGGQFHPGVDIGVPVGTPVYATNDGTVMSAGWNSGGYGNWVEIDNGSGITTVFGHMSRVVAHDGEIVAKGQLIGYSGATGDATGPHLHYEVRVDGTPVNPMKYT